MTLWLIGMMGAGKTTVGRLIAGELGVEFIDTDEEVANRVGCSVAQLWGDLGESAFRDMEKMAVARVAGLEAVVATGGGAPIEVENRTKMASSGTVVWLRASPKEMAARAGEGLGRPLLQDTPSTETALQRLLDQRSQSYEAAADLIIETDGHDPEEVAREVVSAWRP